MLKKIIYAVNLSVISFVMFFQEVETKHFVSRLRIPQVQPDAIVNVKIDRQDAAQIALDLN